MWDREEDPNAKSVAHLLERNESLVTWLQPRDGSVEDQIPVINVKGQYRGLSLRMQKSIWRHVRLKKGFVNLESLSQVRFFIGGQAFFYRGGRVFFIVAAAHPFFSCNAAGWLQAANS